MWDFTTGQEYVRIELVEGDEVIGLVAELPVTTPNAEYIAEMICIAHNTNCVPHGT